VACISTCTCVAVPLTVAEATHKRHIGRAEQAGDCPQRGFLLPAGTVRLWGRGRRSRPEPLMQETAGITRGSHCHCPRPSSRHFKACATCLHNSASGTTTGEPSHRLRHAFTRPLGSYSSHRLNPGHVPFHRGAANPAARSRPPPCHSARTVAGPPGKARRTPKGTKPTHQPTRVTAAQPDQV